MDSANEALDSNVGYKSSTKAVRISSRPPTPERRDSIHSVQDGPVLGMSEWQKIADESVVIGQLRSSIRNSEQYKVQLKALITDGVIIKDNLKHFKIGLVKELNLKVKAGKPQKEVKYQKLKGTDKESYEKINKEIKDNENVIKDIEAAIKREDEALLEGRDKMRLEMEDKKNTKTKLNMRLLDIEKKHKLLNTLLSDRTIEKHIKSKINEYQKLINDKIDVIENRDILKSFKVDLETIESAIKLDIENIVESKVGHIEDIDKIIDKQKKDIEEINENIKTIREDIVENDVYLSMVPLHIT